MDEHNPVDEEESIYRRIHPNFYGPGAPVPILYEAFRPNRNDSAGLSVIRALFALPQALLTNIDPATVANYAIARLSVRALRRIGLTVEPDPLVTGPPGHAIIPELN